MPIHVGLTPYNGNILYYNDADKSIINEELAEVKENDIEKVRSMYKEIVTKINGEPGFICIYVHSSYGNKIRNIFIAEGIKLGFKNAEIINWNIAKYLNAMSQISYRPINENVVWIKQGGYIDVWKIIDQKATFIGCYYFAESLYDFEFDGIKDVVSRSNLNKGPDVVLYKEPFDATYIRKISTTCYFFSYMYDNFINQGCLVKARIEAGDPVVFHLKTVNYLHYNIKVTHCEKEVITFKYGQQLPILCKVGIKKYSNSDVLTISADSYVRESIQIPKLEEVYLTFTVDTNEICTAEFNVDQDNTNSFSHNNDSTSSDESDAFLQSPTTSTADIYELPIIAAIDTDMNVIGIDLGTSRCCAAVNRKNGISTVPLDNTGERLLPSFVSYDEENVKCGKIVVNRLRYHSKSTIFDSKQIIGRNFSDIEIDENWNFSVYNKNNIVYIETNGNNGKKKITAVEVATELLKVVKKKSEEYQGKKILKAVITVPAGFTETQKAETIEAARLAGWNEIVLFPEPIAAAFAYFIDRPIPNNTNVLLFDLGGGTLDVCVFKVCNYRIQIISNTGDTKLGGRNFDTILINYFKNILFTKYGITTIKDKKYKLMLECQRIKEDLSSMIDTSLNIDDFDQNQEGVISIHREEFQRMSQTLVNKIRNTIQSALFTSGYNSSQINRVLQVGGGSRMPMIKELLQELFPLADHCCDEHPDEVVAVGAAYYAYSILALKD